MSKNINQLTKKELIELLIMTMKQNEDLLNELEYLKKQKRKKNDHHIS